MAINLLRERFGKERVIIDTHYKALYQMGQVQSDDIVALRSFYETLELNIRALTALGQDLTNIVPIINLIKSKLPMDLQIIMEKDKGRDVEWTMTNLSQFLKENLELHESLQQPTLPTEDYFAHIESTSKEYWKPKTNHSNWDSKESHSQPARQKSFSSH